MSDYISKADQEILEEARSRFNYCVQWEATARLRFDWDTKFANGDNYNNYQWPQDVLNARITPDNGVVRPCLTINKTAQHNLQIINDAKQNKPGVNIRPVGEEASFDAAQIFQEIVRHIEYISSAEQVYDHATTSQVEGGIGYWRVCTDFVDEDTFDQEIYLRRIKDARSVYLDPDINEADGSDARYGFIFNDVPKDLFDKENPDLKNIGWGVSFNSLDGWISQDHVRVCEYIRKTQKKDKLVTFIDPTRGNMQVLKNLSELDEDETLVYRHVKSTKELRREYQFRERDILTPDIEIIKIAGDRIIDRTPWLGKYIPIVRVVGTETIIDGQLDRKGHTRALIAAQQIYNYNTSANIEYGALQTKAPWIASSEAVEGYEEYYKTANTTNHSYLPYNAFDETGNAIPPPSRPAAPQASPAYVEQMKIAQNEMMMVSGQYQAQMGENENAKSGIAINARQRQGDRATYHFVDNQAIAIRFTGKILIDLIPKIYDTPRVMRISANDGSILNINVQPDSPVPYQKQLTSTDQAQPMFDVIFNPNIGRYDVQADTGPSFATRRQEAFNALTQIASQNKEFMHIAGDILWKVADFPEAQLLSQRWRRVIPKEVLGENNIDPQTQQLMEQASQTIESLKQLVANYEQQLKDKSAELSIKAQEADTRFRTAAVAAVREDYDSETKRLIALGNSGPGISVEQIQPLIKSVIEQMLLQYNPAIPPSVGNGINEGGQSVQQLHEPTQPQEQTNTPAMENA